MQRDVMQWLNERQKVLQEAQCIVVKVGSAVLTNETGLDLSVIQNIADQIAFLHALPTHKTQQRRIVLVSSGAVAAGRAALRDVSTKAQEAYTHCLAGKQAAAAIGQSHLMHHYTMAFAKHGLATAQILLTRDDVRSRQRFLNARNTFSTLLSWGVVPIVNENDTVSVHDLKFGDNDCLASLLVNLVEANLIINLTSAPGVLDKDPNLHPDAAVMPHIPYIHNLDLHTLCSSKTSVGTGGMYAKLLAARRVAHLGVPTLILPGRQPDVMRSALQQHTHGTWIPAEPHSISRRKFWLAYQSEPTGTLFIDKGAASALEEKGGSLLPVGIYAIEGHFSRGALVRIVTPQVSQNDVRTVGLGLCNYSAAELRRVMGMSWETQQEKMLAELGSALYTEAVHRDNLLLDSTITRA